MGAYFIVLAAIFIGGGLWSIGSAIRYAGDRIGEAIWHPTWRDPR